MKRIIDIPEYEYERIKEFYDALPDGGEVDAKVVYIAESVPLPKGHGRLIDGDALEELCYEHEIGNSMFDGMPIIEQGKHSDGDNIWKPLFEYAPTINLP